MLYGLAEALPELSEKGCQFLSNGCTGWAVSLELLVCHLRGELNRKPFPRKDELRMGERCLVTFFNHLKPAVLEIQSISGFFFNYRTQ